MLKVVNEWEIEHRFVRHRTVAEPGLGSGMLIGGGQTKDRGGGKEREIESTNNEVLSGLGAAGRLRQVLGDQQLWPAGVRRQYTERRWGERDGGKHPLPLDPRCKS